MPECSPATRWSRRLCTALAALLSLCALSVGAAEDKPNILVIWGDDVGWSNLSAYHRGLLGGDVTGGPPDVRASRPIAPAARDQR